MSTNDPNTPSDPTSLLPARAEGNKLAGCYALLRRLPTGQGPEVWLAHDEVLGKDVSLHFLPESVRTDARALQELRLDVKRNRQLIHPHILRVYDLVEEPEWVAISMDAFEGDSLAQRFSQKRESGDKVSDVQTWAEQLAQTVEEAHKIHVLHLDLSPANLFLTPAGKLLVANFGISRTIQNAQSRATGKDASDAAFHSPQLREGKPPARADDIYGIGAVLFTAITGTPPDAKDAGAAAALQKDGLSVPQSWQKTIAACLDKNPDARPSSAGEVIKGLAPETSSETPAPAKIPAVEPALVLASKTIEPGKTVPAERSISEPLAAAKVLGTTKAPEPAPKEIRKETAPPKKELEPAKSAPPMPPPKSPERSPLSDFEPRYPLQSRFPLVGIAAAAAAVMIIAIIYHFAVSGKSSARAKPTAQQPEKVDLRAPSPATPKLTTSQPAVAKATPAKLAAATATPTPVTAAADKTSKAIAEKTASMEKARQAAEAAGTTVSALAAQQQTAEVGVAEVQKNIEEKTKAAEPLKKAADEAAAKYAKMQEEQKAAESAAAEAQKFAEQKMRLAEETKKALGDLEKANQEKMAAPKAAEEEIIALQKTLKEKQAGVAESAKALAKAEADKQQQLVLVTKSQQEIEDIKNADAEAKRQREAAEAQKTKLEQEVAEMQRAFQEKMAELESKRKLLDNPGAASPEKPAATPSPAVPAATPPPQTKAATPEPTKLVSIPAAPASVLTETPAPSKKAAGDENSLGMKFARVGDVEFCVWQTRVKDFEVFAKSVNLKSTSWKGPGFKQGPDHPVVNVSWQESIAFCKWLTDKEHREESLATAQFYRLPTDLEWSKAVGLPEESGKTPEVRDMGVPDEYPWGKAWPPPAGAGNYTGEETGSDVAIKGYDDGFAWTSPVGSFAPNKFGLYDMGGNVWQWCMDAWNSESKAKVLRGASWYNGALKLSLLSSCRVHAAPDSSTDNYGFRVVRATEAAKTSKK